MQVLWFNLATDTKDPVLGFATHWIRALARRVEVIHVLTMRAGRVEVPDNVRVYSVGKERSYSEPRRAAEFYRHLLRILHREHIDVCFSHMMPLFTMLAGPVLKAKGIPIVTWYAHPSLTWILKLAHHFSSRVVSSVATAYPYQHEKLTVVGQGIDTDLFSPDGMHPEKPPMILCVGRLSPVKDHQTLLRAACLLRQRWDQPFRVVMVGSPVEPRDELYVESLHKQVKELGLEDTVSFEPPIAMLDLPSWYQRCTVHVNLTSTGYGDKVAWEAMACGRACLVANEGYGETLGEYADYLLFRHSDSQSLVDKLLLLLTLPEKEHDQIGLFLRSQVVRLHSLNNLACNLIKVFHSSMNSHRLSQ
jgi:glycosyltransferase involved in cell wall biosynthesis